MKQCFDILFYIIKKFLFLFFIVFFLFIIYIIFVLYSVFRDNPSSMDLYENNKIAIKQIEETYGTIIGLSKEQVIEVLNEPSVHFIKGEEKTEYLFEQYNDFAEEGADEYMYYLVGDSLFSHRIYLIGFKNSIVVGADYTVEDW